MKMRFILSVSLLVVLSGCIKNNPDPSWIEVGVWTLEENQAGNPAGELTQNITDAWVYVDDKFIGVFEVPFKIPLLLEGAKTVKLYPTILNNGISATKKIYPFLEPYEIALELKPNEVSTIQPVTRYYSTVQFTILDFEDANLGFEESPSTPTNIYASNDPEIIQPFNGNSFGRVSLTSAQPSWNAATNLDKNLPRNGAEVYLEIDYHNTASVVTGVLGISSAEIKENPNVQLNAQSPEEVKWKKIYIELTTIVSGSPNAEYFEHSFESQLKEGATSAEINLDNIKVVHF